MKSVITFSFFVFATLAFSFSSYAQEITTSTQSEIGTFQNNGGQAVLYDQTGFSGTNSTTSQNFETANDGFDNQSADDFVVPSSEIWTIDGVDALGAYYNGYGPAIGFNVFFYSDAAGVPGALVEQRLLSAYTDPSGLGSVSITLSPAVVLPTGTYWVSVQCDMDFSVGGQWGWLEHEAVVSESHWQNPNGGFASCTTWGGRVTSCGIGAAPYFDHAFILNGTIGSGGTMDKLLLTEFVVTPTGGEFIEIFNPNASPVDLTNYFLSDVAFAGGPEYYYHVVWGLYEGGFGDFMSKFPDGATIGAGEHQIIALNGDADFFTTYGVNPTYEIDQAEFQFGPPDGIPDMMETHPGSIFGSDSSHNPGLTNGDEMIMLFYWDGMSDLVGDVDYVLYNSASPAPNNEAVDKTGITIDGPDADTTGSTYLDDTPEANQLSALSPTSGFSAQRFDYSEGSQVMSGGNGVTGSDETSEDMNNTWIVDIPTPFVAIPVELTSFTVQVSDGDVTLNWSTATETNNQGFDIERSSGKGFEKIGFVAGFGTSTEIHNYSYVDGSLDAGTYSYRLKQIDYDGTFEYSDVVVVDVTIPDVFALEQNYPNPFNPSTKIKFSLAADSKVSLTVFDILGQEVANLVNGDLTAGSHSIDFDASNVNSGVYFYRLDATGVEGTNFTSVKKMILTK